MMPVLPVSEARARLTAILRDFRSDPASQDPIVIGSHRNPDAVLVPYPQFRELTSSPRQTGSMLGRLRHRRELVERLARANSVESVRVFGSVARMEEGPDSDVDLLVDPGPQATLFDLAQFEIDLESLFDRPFGVVSSRSLDPERDAGILAEAIAL